MALIIVLTNQSNLAEISDYHYEVLVGNGSVVGSQVLAWGKIKDHTRTLGWRVLVQRLLDEAK